MRTLTAALVLLLTLSAQASYSPDPDYKRVLIPVFYFGGGAFGSAWWTDLELISTEQTFTLGGRAALVGDPACPALCGCDVKAEVESNKVETVCPNFESTAGLILYVPRNLDRETIYTYLRVRDTAKQAERAGTQIPVVWEDELYNSTMMLLDIPSDPRYRTTLRLFDAFQHPTEYSLRFYDMAELRRGNREVLHEVSIETEVVEEDAGRFPNRPAFASVGDLVAAYPKLATVAAYAIEIIGSHPITSPPYYDRRFYALASVTNKTTQEVTVVAPD
jgi:hypothetical protein